MELFFAICLTIWVVVALIGLVVTIVGLCMNASYGDRDDIRFWARLVLAAPVWPILVPAAVYWIVCKAFDRQFPSFEPEK